MRLSDGRRRGDVDVLSVSLVGILDSPGTVESDLKAKDKHNDGLCCSPPTESAVTARTIHGNDVGKSNTPTLNDGILRFRVALARPCRIMLTQGVNDCGRLELYR